MFDNKLLCDLPVLTAGTVNERISANKAIDRVYVRESSGMANPHEEDSKTSLFLAIEASGRFRHLDMSAAKPMGLSTAHTIATTCCSITSLAARISSPNQERSLERLGTLNNLAELKLRRSSFDAKALSQLRKLTGLTTFALVE